MSAWPIDEDQPATALLEALQVWRSTQPFWYQRDMQHQVDWSWADNWVIENPRLATVDEVAASLVQDDLVREALVALNSPAGRIVEQAVAECFLPPWQAKLIVEALSAATEIVMDEQRPAWQRGEVLIGIIGAVIVVAVIASARPGSN